MPLISDARSYPRLSDKPLLSKLGIGWYKTPSESKPHPKRHRTWHGRVIVPFWLPALLSAILPAVAAARYVRERRSNRRRARGLCVVCGYDLRGTPDRCPECGRTAGTMVA